VRQAVQQGNKQQINLVLRQYKLSNGAPNFENLFKIPSKERLPVLAKNDFDGTVDILAAGVTMALETMNLKRPMTPEQINELSEALVDTSHDDNLSLEDLILFMQRLVRGQYGELYEGMDIQKFMQKLELYREERHEEIVRIRENEHLHYRSLGSPERSQKISPLDEHLATYSQKLQEKNDEIKTLRAERKRSQQ
jgi:hypothetical protein